MSRNIYSENKVVSLYGLSRTIPDSILIDYCNKIIAHASPRSLCEVGFGKGSTLIPFATFPNLEVFGVDSSSVMSKFVEEELLKRGLRAKIINADARSLPALLEKVDLVHTKAVTHMFENPREFLTAISRTVPEGGYFVIGKEESQPEDNLENIGKFRLANEEDPVLRDFYLAYFKMRREAKNPFVIPQMPAGDYDAAVNFLVNQGFCIEKEISTPQWTKQITLCEIIEAIREGTFTVFSKNCTLSDRRIYAEEMERFCSANNIDSHAIRSYPSKLKAMILRKQGSAQC